jgi:hypothetical protein
VNDETRVREDRLFRALQTVDTGQVLASEIRRVLAKAGLRPEDPRLKEPEHRLNTLPYEASLDRDAFLDVVRPGLLVLEAVVSGRLAIPDFEGFGA